MLPRPEETEAWLQEQQVIQVLRALPPRQRQVLALTIDGWSPAEIAEMLGIDAAAVRSNLMKARRSADEHRRRAGEEGHVTDRTTTRPGVPRATGWPTATATLCDGLSQFLDPDAGLREASMLHAGHAGLAQGP